MGLIDEKSTDDGGLPLPKPGEHIFVADKVSWLELPEDGLTRYPVFDPPFEQRLQEWKSAGCPKRTDVVD